MPSLKKVIMTYTFFIGCFASFCSSHFATRFNYHSQVLRQNVTFFPVTFVKNRLALASIILLTFLLAVLQAVYGRFCRLFFRAVP